MMDTRLYIGIDVTRTRTRFAYIEPGMGTCIHRRTCATYRLLQVHEHEATQWMPMWNRRDFILAVCADDPWPEGALAHLQERWAWTLQPTTHVEIVLRIASGILKRSLQSERASLLAFLARFDPGCHTVPTLARAWALQLTREQMLRIQTEDWPDFLYDDLTGEPLYDSIHPRERLRCHEQVDVPF